MFTLHKWCIAANNAGIAQCLCKCTFIQRHCVVHAARGTTKLTLDVKQKTYDRPVDACLSPLTYKANKPSPAWHIQWFRSCAYLYVTWVTLKKLVDPPQAQQGYDLPLLMGLHA